jgi:hypothetical protein
MPNSSQCFGAGEIFGLAAVLQREACSKRSSRSNSSNCFEGVEIHKTSIQKDRVDFTGTREQIAGDFATARKLGAAEIVIYAQFLAEGESAKDLVARMEDFWNIAKQA